VRNSARTSHDERPIATLVHYVIVQFVTFSMPQPETDGADAGTTPIDTLAAIPDARMTVTQLRRYSTAT